MENYFNCVHVAAYEGNEQIVRFLVDRWNEFDRKKLYQKKYCLDESETENYNLLVNAGCNGHFSIIKYLIQKGYDIK